MGENGRYQWSDTYFLKQNSDGWTDDLRFYVLFNSISVISGQWVDDNERLCAMEK